jgi:hypothetical protein
MNDHFEGGDELSSTIKCGEFLDQLRNNKHINKVSAIWCLL